MSPHPPAFAGPPARAGDLASRLREAFGSASYTVEGVDALLGPVASAALHREQALPADLATRDTAEPAAVLVRCFTLGRAVPTADLDRALPGFGSDGLSRLGLVDLDGGQARATCELRPYGDEAHDWWLASDLSEVATGRPLPEDHVLGVGPASTTVASWTVRRAVGRALDLGTGCGVQAMHLSAHAQALVGTDVSARALAFARFNAQLAGIDLDLREGSLFEPVAGQRFDLVVSNPPFVITPRSPDVPLYEYRDAGLTGDDLVGRLVREVGDHLEPGGVAQLIGNWEIAAGGSWRDRWQQWLDGVPLDAWVLHRDEQDPAEYAELWARDGGTHGGVAGFAGLYGAWLADFERRGVERIGFGVVTLQRPATDRPPWHDLAEARGAVAAAMGPTVDAGLRARTWLAEHGQDAVLDTAWRCAPDVTEERHGRPGATDPGVIVIRQGGGLGRSFQVDTVGAALVGVCDGDLTARSALQAIAGLLDLETDAVVASTLPLLRDLVADGLLTAG